MSEERDPGMINCKECQERIPAEASKCFACHWVNPNPAPKPYRGKNVDRALDKYPGQCPYEINGLCCPLPASSAGEGKGAILYCGKHSGVRHYDREAEDELRDIIANPFKYVSARHWADELIDHVLHGNPEWNRQPGEARSEYLARMEKRHREQMAAFGSVPMATEERAAMRREVQRQAEAARMEQSKGVALDDRVANATDQLLEIRARHEESGTPPEIALQMAIEDTLRAQLGAPT